MGLVRALISDEFVESQDTVKQKLQTAFLQVLCNKSE